MAATLMVYFANYGLMYLIAPWDYQDAYSTNSSLSDEGDKANT